MTAPMSGAALWQALQLYGHAVNAVARHHAGALATTLGPIADALANLVTHSPTVALGLAALRPEDDDLADHVVRAGLLAAALGRELGFGPPAVVDLFRLALVHEAGTARLPDGLVHRAGALDADERRAVARGASLAVARILEEGDYDRVAGLRVAGLDGLHAPGALVRRDERGEVEAFGEVPRPPVFARLLAIGCVYDALTSTRPYRDPYTPREAVAAMWTELAGRFDPSLLGAFQALLGVGPVRVRSSRPHETPVLAPAAPSSSEEAAPLDEVRPAAAAVASISVAGASTVEFTLDGIDGVELAEAGEPLVVELGAPPDAAAAGGGDPDDGAARSAVRVDEPAIPEPGSDEAWLVVDDQ